MSHIHPEQVMGDLLAPEIEELINQRKMGQVRAALMELMDPEVADLLVDLSPQHQVVALRLLPRDRAAEVFTHLDQEEKEKLVASLSSEQVAQIFNEMDPDDRVDFLEDAPEELSKTLLAALLPEERAETERMLDYPEGSVGREMTPDYLTVRPEWTVAETLDHIRRHGRDAESFNVLYVVDDQGKLLDYIRLRRLLLADPAEKCDTLRQGHVVYLHATDDRETAVHMMERYDLPVLPVVDAGEIMAGIVTFDDVADVAEEEVTEDMQKMGGMEALEVSYMHASIGELVVKRGKWLAVLFLGEMLTASAMTYFQGEIEKAAVVALFLPLIISSGGNSGSQASTLIIRALALGEVTVKDWARVFWRELACGLLLGVFLGVIGMARIHIWQWIGLADYNSSATGGAVASHGGYHIPGLYHDIGFTVGVALIGVVLWGSLMGSMLPFLLRKLGLDPATISAPLVATLVDVTGLIIYFTTALVILHGTLL